MLSKPVQDALNDQIQHELYSAHLYLSMSAYCESINLPGAASWLRAQAREEVGHAMRLFDHINERGGRVTLQAIEQPPAAFDSALSVFEQALAHEQKVTASIHKLYEVANGQNDHAAAVMLQWFITEQVEEEDSASRVVEKFRRAGEDGPALLMLDRELGGRGGDGE